MEKIDFKDLKITSDGIRTQVIVDGKDLGKKCTAIRFKHDTGLDAESMVELLMDREGN